MLSAALPKRFCLLVSLCAVAACPDPIDSKPGGNGQEGEGEPSEGEGEGEGEPADDELDPVRSFLSAAPLLALPADGIAAFTITATLHDGAGRPMSGLDVAFATNLGTLGASTPSDAAGASTTTLTSTLAGSAVVTAAVTTAAGIVTLASPLVVAFDRCRTSEQAWEQELYPKVFSKCQGCHNELGLARSLGSTYQLPFPGVSDWASRSVEVVSPFAAEMATTSTGDQVPRLVGKPLLLLDEGHEGGRVVEPGSEEERLLRAFAENLRSPNSCSGVEDRAEAALARFRLLPPRETYARAKFALTGEVATPEELDAMPDTEEALDDAVDALLATPAFDERLAEMYADWFLTDRFTRRMGLRRVLNRNQQFLDRFFYATEGTSGQQCDPATDRCCREEFSDAYCDGKEDALIDTLAREPVDILTRIVRDDRPISDALTLDHTFVTPLSATFYGFTDADQAAIFDDVQGNDATETAVGRLSRTPRNTLGGPDVQAPVEYPHAGLLTTHAMLARWSTTASNKNRGRAQSIIMRRLMNIDVMKFAEFSTASLPPDADLERATQEQPACTVCHAAVDPLAGFWRHFVLNGQYRVNAPPLATANMPTPSFAGEEHPLDTQGDPVAFLASRVITHERFPLAMLVPVLQGLVGFEELSSAVDPADPEADAKELALEIQHRMLSSLRDRFATVHGLRVKPLVKDIVKSELFRAGDVDAASLSAVERRALELAGVGRGVMLTPEQLDRKIESLLGFAWRVGRNPAGNRLLLELGQYRILWGGLNYDSIAKRFRDPSPVLARIAERMGNELACVAVPQEFATIDQNARRLFRTVDATDDDPAVVRTELKRLHRLLLEEEVADGDEELEASLTVFEDTLARGRALIASGDAPSTLRADCRATESFEATPVSYPSAGKVAVVDDPQYIIRAWMAVLSYLLADPRFMFE